MPDRNEDVFGWLAKLAAAFVFVGALLRLATWFEPARAPDAGAPTEVQTRSAVASKTERTLVGTWFARGYERLPTPIPTSGWIVAEGDVLLDPSAEACTWIELRDDLTGFHFECMMSDGVPARIELSGPDSDDTRLAGAPLTWGFDGNTLEIEYAEPVFIEDEDLHVRLFDRTELRIERGEGRMSAVQSFPTLPGMRPINIDYDFVPDTLDRWGR